MKKRQILLSGLIVLILSIGTGAAAECSLVGTWGSNDGSQIYEFFENGTGQTIVAGQTYLGTWANENDTFTTTWSYGPLPGEFYRDTVTISADCDSYAGTNNYGASVQAARIVNLPFACSDSYSLNQDSVLIIAGPGILINDYNPNRDNLTAFAVSSPLNGDLVSNTDGSFTYTPYEGWWGNDTFSYRVNNETAEGTIAQVRITVTKTENPATNPATYMITTSDVGGGEISPPGPIELQPGENQMFLVLGDKGSRLTSLTIDSITIDVVQDPPSPSSENQGVIDIQSLIVTFENILSDHTIHAVFTPPAK